MRRFAFALAAGVLGAACGGGAAKAPASAPGSGGAAPAEAPANAPYANPPPPVPPPGTSTSSPAPAGEESLSVAPSQTGRDREAALRSARTDLERAERELQSSASDCAAACRALASMERATGHLCDLASGPSDRTRCEDAKTKVLAARDRIRASCGVCAGGPTLEHGARIPSGT